MPGSSMRRAEGALRSGREAHSVSLRCFDADSARRFSEAGLPKQLSPDWDDSHIKILVEDTCILVGRQRTFIAQRSADSAEQPVTWDLASGSARCTPSVFWRDTTRNAR